MARHACVGVMCLLASSAGCRAVFGLDDPVRGMPSDGSTSSDGGDANGDGGALDDAVTPPCMARWYGHDVQFAAPEKLAISGPNTDYAPYLSTDELTLVFTSERPGSMGHDIWSAMRSSIGQSFASPTLVPGINSSASDGRLFSATQDGLIAAFTSDRAGGEGADDIWLALRTGPQAVFSATQIGLAAVNDNTAQNDPHISDDGLRLYHSPNAGGIRVASRVSILGNFSVPQLIAPLDSANEDGDPSLSSDERMIIFSSNRPGTVGTVSLWYSVRASATAVFDTPQIVPNVNASTIDVDPFLSSDGCRIYFSSNRMGGFDLYVASML